MSECSHISSTSLRSDTYVSQTYVSTLTRLQCVITRTACGHYNIIVFPQFETYASIDYSEENDTVTFTDSVLGGKAVLFVNNLPLGESKMEKVAKPTYRWAWEHVTAHALITLLGLAGIVYVGVRIAEGYVWPSIATILLGLIYWRIGLYAITFMHRYYVHEQFKVKSAWVQILSTLAFYSTLQSPIRIWRGWHRQHHDKVDTYKDRTSPVVHGAMHAHMLVWMRKQFIKPAPARYSKNLDTAEYAVAMKFEPYYLPLALALAFVLPTLIAWIGWNDPIGGLGFGGFTRLLILLHTTWTINSLMHMKGEKMEGARSATNSHSRLFTWLIVGEPNHARHHKWPDNYRFGTFDPGARMIEWMEERGLVYDLKKARDLA